MERCPGSEFPIKMVSLDAGWSDLGAWDAVWQVLPKDGAGNARRGDVLLTRQPQHAGPGDQSACHLVGVSDLVVIETPTPFWLPTSFAART